MKQETLEEAAATYACGWGENDDEKSFIAGAKWQAERMYSEEEMHKLMDDYQNWLCNTDGDLLSFKEWFEQFKKK